MSHDDPPGQAELGWLGAEGAQPKANVVAVFVPSKTRDGQPIDHDYWRDEAIRVMSSLFGGATAVEARGGWQDKERGGYVQQETVWIVFSFFADEKWSQENIVQLGAFLRRMARETEQGEVGVYLRGPFLVEGGFLSIGGF